MYGVYNWHDGTKNATGPLWGNINTYIIHWKYIKGIRYKGNSESWINVLVNLFSNFSLIRTLRSEKWARTVMVVHNRIFLVFYKSLKIKVDFGRNLLRDITLQYYKNCWQMLILKILQNSCCAEFCNSKKITDILISFGIFYNDSSLHSLRTLSFFCFVIHVETV